MQLLYSTRRFSVLATCNELWTVTLRSHDPDCFEQTIPRLGNLEVAKLMAVILADELDEAWIDSAKLELQSIVSPRFLC